MVSVSPDSEKYNRDEVDGRKLLALQEERDRKGKKARAGRKK